MIALFLIVLPIIAISYVMYITLKMVYTLVKSLFGHRFYCSCGYRTNGYKAFTQHIAKHSSELID